jgi:hypothetical protein
MTRFEILLGKPVPIIYPVKVSYFIGLDLAVGRDKTWVTVGHFEKDIFYIDYHNMMPDNSLEDLLQIMQDLSWDIRIIPSFFMRSDQCGQFLELSFKSYNVFFDNVVVRSTWRSDIEARVNFEIKRRIYGTEEVNLHFPEDPTVSRMSDKSAVDSFYLCLSLAIDHLKKIGY